MLWSVLAACIGVLVLLWGARWHRRGPELRCRCCEQIVEGISAGVCPECGAKLNRRGGTARGERRKHWWRILGGLALILLSSGNLARQVDETLTQAGWQLKVPAWWLSEVELRFADGARLEQAYAGLMFAHDQHRASDYAFRSGGRRALRQMIDLLKVGKTPSPTLRSLVLTTTNEFDVDEVLVAQIIQQHTTVRDAGWHGVVECTFLPRGWKLEYECELKDAQGMLMLPLGKGASVGDAGGNLERLLFVYDFPPPPVERSASCIWTMKALPRNSTSRYSLLWQVVNAFKPVRDRLK